MGPCDYAKTTQVWNDANVGKSKITSWTFPNKCPTSVKGCEVTSATMTSANVPGSLVFLSGVPGEAIGTKATPLVLKFVVAGATCGWNTDTYVATSIDSIYAKHTGNACFTLIGTMSVKDSVGTNFGTVSGQECRDVKGQTVIPK
ncbi:MAG TPA: hypothetical protein VEP91_09265 [Solirubrobacterales bacterium]|nr:hypothetical protein [Solirubrobacterales bacterium]